eukprot:CAMPEP_0113321268 /NCGR_PEP_ID=MMETSP0010_2-20120614/14805_1 /TAXON_ID=216773 ORGANISM="Corethron hystrix, Strain 308" /NCGR_SAMPLE_ID=MMETSP0010_2 /ASSEMBLY_ACC=CAM_ASM_000155 /LENGTH=91 /DNA_ID=CAMNT_0000179337 /DNA_START=207 /DNA_END=482 /DNA_ORIENTATION=- /assembly_acc=CAM_ASM_000155
MRGGVTIISGYSAETAVPIDCIIDLSRSDENNPNEPDDSNVVVVFDEGDDGEGDIPSADGDGDGQIDRSEAADLLLAFAASSTSSISDAPL